MARGQFQSDRALAPKPAITVSQSHQHKWGEPVAENGITFRVCTVKACRATEAWNSTLGQWV